MGALTRRLDRLERDDQDREPAYVWRYQGETPQQARERTGHGPDREVVMISWAEDD